MGVSRGFSCHTYVPALYSMQALSKGRSNLAPGKGEVGMETYEFLTFLVVFTVLIISVKR